jgi:signal transduction histidine kinase
VLTHEIINSVSPITLLSSTLVKMFEKDGKPKQLGELEQSEIVNALSGLQAISKRSNGLSRFVESYKSLTKIPEPEFAEIGVKELFGQIILLMKKGFSSSTVELSTRVIPDDLTIIADEKMIEQVLINLIKNAMEAGDGKLKILLAARAEKGTVKIEVSDNGPGISMEVIDNIFVPFYTTKKDGSGIGLSLSRQIIRKHGGNLEVISKEGEGATFVFSL